MSFKKTILTTAPFRCNKVIQGLLCSTHATFCRSPGCYKILSAFRNEFELKKKGIKNAPVSLQEGLRRPNYSALDTGRYKVILSTIYERN